MSVAPTLPPRREWTVDDLSELPVGLRYELIDGRLVVPSPTVAHQDLMIDVALALRVNCPPKYVVSVDQSMRVDRRNEPRPDVVAVREEHYGVTPVPVADAVLAVEVVSPDSTIRDMYDKRRLYGRAGVAAYWVIDPLHEAITLTEMALAGGGEYRTVVRTAAVFRAERPWSVTLDLPALTKRRAALLASSLSI
jgi:Uma2 family endonuclease